MNQQTLNLVKIQKQLSIRLINYVMRVYYLVN